MCELDLLDLAIDRLVERLTRRFVCADCGRLLELSPPRESEETPWCCEWEMVELMPADPNEPRLTVVAGGVS